MSDKQEQAKCNAVSARGNSRCQVPAGFGVPDSLGVGPCRHHREVEVLAGDDVMATTHGAAVKMQPDKKVFRYEMEGDSRLAKILRGMGASMVVDRAPSGVAHLDLDFELKSMRAMLIIFMERYQEREDALLSWATAYEAGDLQRPPPKILTVEMGHKAVVGIAQVAKIMHDIQGSIPKAEFMQMMVDMADVVSAHVPEAKVRRKIQKQWLQVCAKYVV